MSDPRQADHLIHPLFVERWSPRAFTDEAIDEATLHGLFEAARWAPSSFNAQPWRYLYGHRGTPAWQPIFDSLAEFNRVWAAQASVLVLALSNSAWTAPGKSEPQTLVSHSFDAGAAWAHLALQATHAGWHAHGIGGFDRERLRAALAVPADHRLEAVIAIGRRADKSQLPDSLQAREQPSLRRPLSELVGQGRFDFQ